MAEALEASAPYYSVVYLGLGRNLVTHKGLERLVQGLGARQISEKKEADAVSKEITAQGKERDKLLKKPDPPKVDGNGRERYKTEFQVDRIEETPENVWMHFRNVTLQTLNLEENQISDASVVLRLKPFGVGDLVLRGNPCATELLGAPQEAGRALTAEDGTASATVAPATLSNRQGWRLLLR